MLDTKNIPVKYRPIPFWSWNDKLNCDVLRNQIRQMHQQGIGGFFMHARGGLQTIYMSKEWMDCIYACLDEAGKLGMEGWLYDENGWPSGFGGGVVNALGENYQQKYLRYETGFISELKTQNTIAYYKEDGSYIGKEIPNHYNEKLIRCYYEINPYYVDNLDSKVVKKFIESTYEFYYQNIPDNLLKHLKGIFTDEPQLSRNGFVWSFILDEEYLKAYNEDLLKVLPQLFIGGKNCQSIRIKYWKLITKLFQQNFMKQVYDFCEEHNWKITGHHVLEETCYWQTTANGAIMPHYRYYHIPGMDLLCRNHAKTHAMVQLASTCMQFDKKQILTESFALTGWNFNFSGMEWLYNNQMAHGVNLLCQHLQGYSLRGARKRDYPCGNFVHQPWWNEYHYVNNSFARTGMFLANGKDETQVLVIHPQSSAWAIYDEKLGPEDINYYSDNLEKLTEELEAYQISCHYADELNVEDAGSIKDNNFIIGFCQYNVVIIPPVTNLSSKITQLLKEYTKNGGTIFRLLNTKSPDTLTIDGIIANQEDTNWFKSIPYYSSIESVAKQTKNVCKVNLTILEKDVPARNIVSTSRTFTKNKKIEKFYFITNKLYNQPNKVTVKVPATAQCIEVIDKYNGNILKIKDVKVIDNFFTFNYTFAPGESLQLYVSDSFHGKEDDFFDTTDYSNTQAVKKLDNNFVIKDIGQGNILTLDRCRYRVDNGPWIYDDTIVIHHRLLKLEKDCLLEMEYDFTIGQDFDLSTPLTLVTETPEAFSYKLNGKEFSNQAIGTLFDQAFMKLVLPQNLKRGINTLYMKTNYHQDDEVYKSLKKAKKFETEYNKLVFNSEVESSYLLGNFSVTNDGIVENLFKGAKRYHGNFVLGNKLTQQTIDAANLTSNGLLFFSGKVNLTKEFNLTKDEVKAISKLRFTPKGANSFLIKLNGKEAGFLFSGHYIVDVKDLLKTGLNTLEIEVTTSLRNTLGPHHLECGESYSVGTLSFNKEPNVLDWPNNPYNENYCNIEYGLDNIEFL